MSYKKVLSIVVAVVLTIQLSDTSGVKSETNYSSDAMDQSTQSSDVGSGNVTEEATMTTTSTFQSDIRIVGQKYKQEPNGAYKLEISFSNQNWRAEHGEYEDHDGVVVFVIRGVFQHYTKEGNIKYMFYMVDEFGYHNVETPPQLSNQGGTEIADYRPEFGSASECDDSKSTNCVINPKLLALLVG